MRRSSSSLCEAHVLATEADLARAVDALTRQCRLMRAVHARTGLPPLREFTADFAGLARIVVGQQLSASSAAAIWGRCCAAFDPFEPGRILKASDAALKAPGLSAGKIRTLRALACGVHSGDIDFAELNTRGEADIREALTAVHGIGPWTAEIYLLFALRRADSFPSGDLALQLAAQQLFELGERPSAAGLTAIAERWRPWRGAAARLLWADYALMRARAKEPPSAGLRKSSRGKKPKTSEI